MLDDRIQTDVFGGLFCGFELLLLGSEQQGQVLRLERLALVFTPYDDEQACNGGHNQDNGSEKGGNFAVFVIAVHDGAVTSDDA